MTTTTAEKPELNSLHGAFLVDKPSGVSSFGMIETLHRQWRHDTGRRKSELPKLGHGGTLDPFATGLMVVCVGNGVKLSRYFLGSKKTYEGEIRFGETTVPGDPTEEISERSDHLPGFEEARKAAHAFTLAPYSQIPPMHSAKKKDGKPLYELARQGIEIEREPKLCVIESFELDGWETRDKTAHCRFRVVCGSGTYIRVLAQDLARGLGSVGMLGSLRRTDSGAFSITRSVSFDALLKGDYSSLVAFDQMLSGYPRAQATAEQTSALRQGKQQTLHSLLDPDLKAEKAAIYSDDHLIAVATRGEPGTNVAWVLERVF
jgi:tRNA pseudouridine55 synthase